MISRILFDEVITGPQTTIKRILVGLGGTPFTPTSIRLAIELAQSHQAEVTGVTLLDESNFIDDAAESPIQVIEDQERLAKAKVLIEESVAAIHATEKLIAYFVPHYMHLDYRGRLEAGRTIGSGAVEGAIKQVVTRRLKQTGARWRPENAVRMVTLCSTALTDEWDAYWKSNTPSLTI